MLYGSVFLLAMLISLFAGALGSVGWFLFSALMFVGSLILCWFETKNLTFVFGIAAALIWSGAMGGLSWPLLRYSLPILGLILSGIGFYVKGRIKINRMEKE